MIKLKPPNLSYVESNDIIFFRVGFLYRLLSIGRKSREENQKLRDEVIVVALCLFIVSRDEIKLRMRNKRNVRKLPNNPFFPSFSPAPTLWLTRRVSPPTLRVKKLLFRKMHHQLYPRDPRHPRRSVLVPLQLRGHHNLL